MVTLGSLDRAHPAADGRRCAHEVVIRLAAVEDCWEEFTTPGGKYLSLSIFADSTSKRWRAIGMRLGTPGGIKLQVDGTNSVPPGTVELITLRLQRHGGSPADGRQAHCGLVAVPGHAAGEGNTR